MKLKIGFVLGMGLALLGCPSPPEPPPENLLRVGMDPAIGFPFVYKAAGGENWGGFEYEVAAYLAQKTRKKLLVQELRWTNLLQAVTEKKIDLALNAIEKPEDASAKVQYPQIAFTTHYYTAFQQLVVLKSDNFTYNLSDLKGKKVGVISPSVGELLLKEINQKKQAGIQIMAFSRPEELFRALSQGQISASLTERALASWNTGKLKNLRLTGEPITEEIPYVGAVHAENKELLKSLNQVLEAARNDQGFKEIFKKWHLVIKR